jgi:hypothetical protein
LKKTLISIVALNGLLYAGSTISYQHGIKDYKNSMSKIDGKVQILSLSHRLSSHDISFTYQGDNVDRSHSITKVNLPSLDVEKYSAKYQYKLNQNIALNANYIKIIDNLATIYQGKVYGIGAKYFINKSLSSKVKLYKSDYKKFDVNQLDISISKKFKIDNIKLKTTAIAKKIDINGNSYGNYNFKDKDYFTTALKIGANYNGYIFGVGSFFGKRVFTVLDDGTKVQHHAMEQNKTYMISVGKKIDDFTIKAKYSYQNGKELPENRDNVDTKIVSLSISYKY